MRLRNITIILASVLLFVSVAGCAQKTVDRVSKNGELVVGTAGSMPPLNMTTKDGEVIGFDMDLARRMAKAMNVELRVETMAFAELLPALEAGQVDMIISGMTITPERNLRVAFAGPYLAAGKCILTKEQAWQSVDEPSDLDQSGISLAALEGSTSQMFVEKSIPEARLVATKDYDEAVNLVLTNNVSGMIADYPFCIVPLFQHPNQGLVSVVALLSYEPLGIAMSANDPLLVNWVDNFLDHLEQSGELEFMKARWFQDGSWLNDLP